MTYPNVKSIEFSLFIDSENKNTCKRQDFLGQRQGIRTYHFVNPLTIVHAVRVLRQFEVEVGEEGVVRRLLQLQLYRGAPPCGPRGARAPRHSPRAREHGEPRLSALGSRRRSCAAVDCQNASDADHGQLSPHHHPARIASTLLACAGIMLCILRPFFLEFFSLFRIVLDSNKKIRSLNESSSSMHHESMHR